MAFLVLFILYALAVQIYVAVGDTLILTYQGLDKEYPINVTCVGGFVGSEIANGALTFSSHHSNINLQYREGGVTRHETMSNAADMDSKVSLYFNARDAKTYAVSPLNNSNYTVGDIRAKSENFIVNLYPMM